MYYKLQYMSSGFCYESQDKYRASEVFDLAGYLGYSVL